MKKNLMTFFDTWGHSSVSEVHKKRVEEISEKEEVKVFKGKAIYTPTGKAQEYARFACNFYVGCSNGCTYCYLKKGIGKKVLGGDFPTLKTCFDDDKHALTVFKKELLANLDELQRHGLFFTFTSDPFLPETTLLNQLAMRLCMMYDVPMQILTKRADWLIDQFVEELKENGTIWNYEPKIHLWSFGFTLTGCDEIETGASTNVERIFGMKKLHDAGFKTWASIEPIVDIPKSLAMINLTNGFCDLYKIGVMSGKYYPKADLQAFVQMLLEMYPNARFYFKDTLLKKAGISRDSLPENCVGRDFNLQNIK